MNPSEKGERVSPTDMYCTRKLILPATFALSVIMIGLFWISGGIVDSEIHQLEHHLPEPKTWPAIVGVYQMFRPIGYAVLVVFLTGSFFILRRDRIRCEWVAWYVAVTSVAIVVWVTFSLFTAHCIRASQTYFL